MFWSLFEMISSLSTFGKKIQSCVRNREDEENRVIFVELDKTIHVLDETIHVLD